MNFVFRVSAKLYYLRAVEKIHNPQKLLSADSVPLSTCMSSVRWSILRLQGVVTIPYASPAAPDHVPVAYRALAGDGRLRRAPDDFADFYSRLERVNVHNGVFGLQLQLQGRLWAQGRRGGLATGLTIAISYLAISFSYTRGMVPYTAYTGFFLCDDDVYIVIFNVLHRHTSPRADGYSTHPHACHASVFHRLSPRITDSDAMIYIRSSRRRRRLGHLDFDFDFLRLPGERTAMKASCGMETPLWPTVSAARFLPSFCLFSSFFLRVTSPP